MKKLKILFLLAASTSFLLTGCGQKNSTEQNAVENFTQESEEESVIETEAETTEVEDLDAPPADGMVRSVVTNEWIPEDVANTRPIAVMMPTDKEALPLYNIGNAGVLYECMEEGSISRQLAIIEDWTGMKKIGNIRSCRLYYIFLATEWDPLLVHFGGVYYMQDRITASDIENISGTSEYGSGGLAPGSNQFFRSTDKQSPHNAYISGEGILKACDELGYTTSLREEYYNEQHFQFTTKSEPNLLEVTSAKDATSIDLSDCFPVTKSSFTYNEEEGVYEKWIYGEEQTDAVTGEQLSFANVIVQNTYYETVDAKGYLSFQIHDNTRDGYYFTKGKMIHINWEKASDYSPTKYYDDNGCEITLNTGKTFIAIVQDGTEIQYK